MKLFHLKNFKMKKLIFFSALALFMIPALSFNASSQGKVVWTQVVQLTAEEAGTDVNAKGIAIFRLTADMMLHYRLNVQQPDDGDMQTAAHIHFGAAGVNGGVAIGLAMSASDFNRNMSVQLTQQQYNTLLNDNLYVNFHSVWYPSGNIRGQIR